jgi:NDP-sugar pyrophosphorylase family protein
MKAMVLCAGYGTRLGRLVEQVPKPMIPLGDRPLLEYILRNLARHGFDHIAVNVHFQPEAIRDYFGDGARLGVRLVYSHEPELLGTAGGVKKVAGFLGGSEPFLVHYGDVVTNQDFTVMLQFHRSRQALATLLVHRRARSNSVVAMDAEGRIVGFLERPSDQERDALESPWVNSGIAICNPELLGEIPAGIACDLPRDVYVKLVSGGRLFGFPLTGFRCAVDSPERLAEARAAVDKELEIIIEPSSRLAHAPSPGATSD